MLEGTFKLQRFLSIPSFLPFMYKLELEHIIKEIKTRKAKRVVIQVPDGLKPRAKEIVDTIKDETNASVFIWFSSCFGACDLPLGLRMLQIDLMVQFGHNKYNKTPEEW